MNETITAARRIVDTGLWYLAEYYGGEFHLNKNPDKFEDVSEYLLSQARFKHLKPEDIEQIEIRDKEWEKIRKEWLTL